MFDSTCFEFKKYKQISIILGFKNKTLPLKQTRFVKKKLAVALNDSARGNYNAALSLALVFMKSSGADADAWVLKKSGATATASDLEIQRRYR